MIQKKFTEDEVDSALKFVEEILESLNNDTDTLDLPDSAEVLSGIRDAYTLIYSMLSTMKTSKSN